MKLNNIRYTDEDINNLDDYYSKEIEEYKEIEKSLNKEINKLTAESTEWESKYYDLQKENERLKLNQTKKVFDTIAELIKDGETCSYRYLIYDLLGFQKKDYADLMGGIAITNMLVDYEDLKNIQKEHSIMKQFIYENGLWERFLNDDRFIEHLRGDKDE